MKHIEELKPGQCFRIKDNEYYIITCDFDRYDKKYCINLLTGSNRWFNANDIIDEVDIYSLDQDNNIVPIKRINDVIQ